MESQKHAVSVSATRTDGDAKRAVMTKFTGKKGFELYVASSIQKLGDWGIGGLWDLKIHRVNLQKSKVLKQVHIEKMHCKFPNLLLYKNFFLQILMIL